MHRSYVGNTQNTRRIPRNTPRISVYTGIYVYIRVFTCIYEAWGINMQGRMRNTNRIRGNTLRICVRGEYAQNTQGHMENTQEIRREHVNSYFFKDPVSKGRSLEKREEYAVYTQEKNM